MLPLSSARFQAERTRNITESVIREMTRLAMQHNAVNLAQGFPDFAAPAHLKQAAIDAITSDQNQYAITWGTKRFRNAIATKYRDYYQLEIDPERQITVTCGATEGMIASLLAIANPGDEVIVFEPYYENFGPDSYLCGATRKIVPLHAPDWSFDPEELRRAFSKKTKAIIINSPGNPTGQVFSREQMAYIGSLCQEFDAIAITDEIYEHIVYDGAKHTPMICLPGMADRTLLVNSMSKTYSVTGWRVGWVIGSPALTDTVRKVHDFLTVCAATPLQEAGVTALASPPEYYAKIGAEYTERRDFMLAILERSGFRCLKPRGAYYIMADISHLGFENDIALARHMVEKIGVAAVPGSSFFSDPADGSRFIRFCFAKKRETLEEAGARLAKL